MQFARPQHIMNVNYYTIISSLFSSRQEYKLACILFCYQREDFIIWTASLERVAISRLDTPHRHHRYKN